ncbi:hypothetical protein R5R35_004828 [Gryllus longicercus]|uniref:Uncharacterized protein n=1 Tax=Gryllus longicercus TaxID=2509291 RepID=A0AAN9V3S4_9ORTH
MRGGGGCCANKDGRLASGLGYSPCSKLPGGAAGSVCSRRGRVRRAGPGALISPDLMAAAPIYTRLKTLRRVIRTGSRQRSRKWKAVFREECGVRGVGGVEERGSKRS